MKRFSSRSDVSVTDPRSYKLRVKTYLDDDLSFSKCVHRHASCFAIEVSERHIIIRGTRILLALLWSVVSFKIKKIVCH